MVKVLLLFLALLSTDPREIAKINSLKKEAESSFKAGQYEDALAKFQLLDSLGVASLDLAGWLFWASNLVEDFSVVAF